MLPRTNSRVFCAACCFRNSDARPDACPCSTIVDVHHTQTFTGSPLAQDRQGTVVNMDVAHVALHKFKIENR